MWNTVLFDLDGTLTDSGEGITRCVQYALRKEFGIEVSDLHELDCFVGPPLKEQFMEYASLSAEEGERAIRAYRERYRTRGIYENRVYEGIPHLLEQLAREHMTLAVASSKPTEFCREILRYFGIEQYFRVIVGSEMNGERTKKADVIEETLRRLGAEHMRASVVLVGDRRYDVEGAKEAGIGSIGVTYGYGSREELEAAWPDCIVDSAEELRNVLIGQFRDGYEAGGRRPEGTGAGGASAEAYVPRVYVPGDWPYPAQGYPYPPEGWPYPAQGYQYPPQGYPYPPEGGRYPAHYAPYPAPVYPYPPAPYGYPAGSAPAVYPGSTQDSAPYPESRSAAFSREYEAERAAYRRETSVFCRIWRVLYPLLLDEAVQLIVVNAAMALLFFLYGGEHYQDLYQAHSFAILGIADLLLIPLFAWLFRADERKRAEGRGMYAGFARGRITVLQVLALIVFTYCVSTVIDLATSWIPMDSAVYEQLDETIMSSPVWIRLLVACVTGPVMEELLFRALVFRRLRDYMQTGWAVLISAAVFGAAHGNLYQGVYAFLFGILMALIYEHYGTIWMPILAHAVNNAAATFAIPFLARKTPMDAYLYEAGTVLLTILMGCVIFSKKRRVNAV